MKILVSKGKPEDDLRLSAKKIISTGQKIMLIILLLGTACGLVFEQHLTAIVFVTFAMVFWLIFVGFKIRLWIASRSYDFNQSGKLININDPNLPIYTIFVPLYKEAEMVEHIISWINKLTYPKSKLQVMLLLESDDEITWQKVNSLDLPFYIEPISVPDGGPRTKPNALNVGLELARGEYCVIYDAEDQPEPDQLLRSVSMFRQLPSDFVCIQARLAFWNEKSNILTRFYWAEYITHFQWNLVGLSALGLIPPLGGTSNHFVTSKVYEVGGWDPYNVTEDADMAAALAYRGYKIGMLDSTTHEEATANIRTADRQRRRWIKGYAQTGLVYTRHPIKIIKNMGLKNWFCFNLLMLGTMISLILNPIFWGITIVYFVTRASIIEQLFPLPLYYSGILLMIVGNLVLFYQLVTACLEKKGYSSVKYMIFAPLWWLFTSWSAYAALVELIIRPHHWHKTQHGHDVNKEIILREQNA